jgi:predicted transposase/invertase (TIGR01784 family)
MQFWVFGSELEDDKMSAMLQDCPPVQAAYEEFKRFSADPVMREKTKARERFLTEQQLIINHTREEGFIKGEAKGREEKALETAVVLKSMGMSLSDIARATGLPVSDIERL